MTHHLPSNQHYKPSIFYLSLYLLIILLSQFICSNIFSPVSRSAPKPTPSGYKTFTHSEDNYSFQYPASWQVSSTASGVDITTPNSPYYVNIKTIKNQSHPEKLISDWEKSPFYKVNSDSNIQIGGLKTLELLDSSSSPIHDQYLLYALHNNVIYEATFLTNNTSLTSTITQILTSIKFLDPPTPTVVASPYNISPSDSGQVFYYSVGDRFALTLDKKSYSLKNMFNPCPQIGWISNLSVNGPDDYPIGYEATLPGTCIIKNGNFSVTLQIKP